MKNCVLLKNRFDVSAANIADASFNRTFARRQRYNRDLDEKYTAIPINTLSLPKSVTDDLLRQLPQSVLEIEIPQVLILTMEASDAPLPTLAAHVDLNRSCGINIYLETSGEKTHYYDWDQETQTMVETEHFVAESGDCWLIDTQVPHSVSLVTGKKRSMLTYSFVSAPYNRIKEAICE